jgi:fatty acid desaturase
VSRQQFAFIIAVLLVWLAWAAGWVVLAAVAAGLIGVAVVRVLEGDVDLDELVGRFRSSSSSKRP